MSEQINESKAMIVYQPEESIKMQMDESWKLRQFLEQKIAESNKGAKPVLEAASRRAAENNEYYIFCLIKYWLSNGKLGLYFRSRS